MKTKTRAYKRIKRGSCRHLLAVLIAAVFFLSGISTAFAGTAEFEDYSDLAGKRISMLTGAPFEELVRSKVPDVGEFSYYNSMPDMILALKNNKTDAILMNNAVADLALNRNQDLALFPKELQDGVFGFAFAKGGISEGMNGRLHMEAFRMKQRSCSGRNGPVQMKRQRPCLSRTGRETVELFMWRYVIRWNR